MLKLNISAESISRHFSLSRVLLLIAAVFSFTSAGLGQNNGKASVPQAIEDPSGKVQTFSQFGFIDTNSAFFQNLGTNGRTCNSCHQESDAWGISARHVQERFLATGGTDPIFRPVDGAVCPTADVSTFQARIKAYSMLLSKGLIRVSMPVPQGPGVDFKLIAIDDPYHCATPDALALFRRPLPSTNLRFLSGIMWDGREPSLASQAADATMGHAQGKLPTDQQLQDIVNFESSVYTAQVKDKDAGSLTDDGAMGGPLFLSVQNYYAGINDVFGGDPEGNPFNTEVFNIYQSWKNPENNGEKADARSAVARGEELFNTLPIPLTGVGGINDDAHPLVMGNCTTCHDSPNVGNHSLPVPLNIGLADESRRTPDMPLYTFQCNDGTIVKVTDPGRGLITGKCSDLGRFKGSILRGLAARAPYFHNGLAATLLDVVNFYDTRFNLHLTDQQKNDLVAFLKTL
jgi:cytochrome c peroxidase